MPNFMQLQVVKIDLQMILCLKSMIYWKDGDKGRRNDSLLDTQCYKSTMGHENT